MDRDLCLALIENVFEMTNGQVLGFQTRKSFQSFVAEHTKINIEKSNGYSKENSMAKKLRFFVKHEDETIVSTLLLALLNKRETIMANKKEWNPDFQDSHIKAANDLKCEAQQTSVGTRYSTSSERLSADLQSARKILNDLQSVLKSLVCNHTYTDEKKENEFNDYIRDMLKQKGYNETHDQTRHGASETGKDAGEVDLLLAKDGNGVALIECLKLTSVDTTKLRKHIQKATINYNPLGTTTFLIIYVCATKFEEFCNSLYSYLSGYNFELKQNTPIQKEVQENAAIWVSTTIFEKDKYPFPVYFIAVNVLKST